ncbi:hypothetical protein Ahy_A10g047397 [Arachis hypogaea]|uniref:Uncharacterized protein n=1 Tax=Arachis hypogaea TaxID=3818 RepID=A0A445B2E8_ARAHY|nr:hypothetical protein Ahy_A10g047397 [Arachis hypogaea]
MDLASLERIMENNQLTLSSIRTISMGVSYRTGPNFTAKPNRNLQQPKRKPKKPISRCKKTEKTDRTKPLLVRFGSVRLLKLQPTERDGSSTRTRGYPLRPYPVGAGLNPTRSEAGLNRGGLMSGAGRGRVQAKPAPTRPGVRVSLEKPQFSPSVTQSVKVRNPFLSSHFLCSSALLQDHSESSHHSQFLFTSCLHPKKEQSSSCFPQKNLASSTAAAVRRAQKLRLFVVLQPLSSFPYSSSVLLAAQSCFARRLSSCSSLEEIILTILNAHCSLIHLLVAVAVSLAIAIACEPVTGAPFLCLSESVTIQELKNHEEEVKRNQSLKSLLLSPCEQDGWALFRSSSYERCTDFTFGLVEFYDKLRSDEESFEIVMIPLDEDGAGTRRDGLGYYSLLPAGSDGAGSI